MKKIQKQLAKEKARNEEKKKDIDQKKIKKEERKGKKKYLTFLSSLKFSRERKVNRSWRDIRRQRREN